MMRGLDPACVPDVTRRDAVWHPVQWERFRKPITRQVEVSEKHNVRIENAEARMRQRRSRCNLQNLLNVPAAHWPRTQRPPMLAALTADDSGQGAQPSGQELACRQHRALRT